MAKPIWSGSISFGLVNVPVRLVSTAGPSRELRFRMLHDADGAPIKERRFCSVDGAEVPYEHVVKGYPISPGHFVTLTREELSAFDPAATKTIDIESFADLAEIDPLYFDTTYYVVPDKGAGKAYALLAEAMASASKVGIARVVLRTRQYLCAVRPVGDALALSTLHYPDEVIQPTQVEGLPEKAKASERELSMARQLIDSLAAPFKAADYQDLHRAKVLELIEEKARGHQIVAAEPSGEKAAKAVNLADALEASLHRVKAAPGRGSAAAGKTRREASAPPAHRPKHRRSRRTA